VSWVRKEAALKALHVGFVVDPGALRTPQPGRAGVVLPGRPPVTLVDLLLDDDRHVAALGLAAAYGAVRVTVHPVPDRL
jgi:4'-phosphopantetheinyl transferase